MLKVKDIYPLIIETINSGKTFEMPIHGTSMQPLLHTGDLVTLTKITDIKKNDIVFYRRADGSFVLHRVYRANPDGTYTMIGDHQIVLENGIKKEQCFAKALAYKKQNKSKKSFLKGFRYSLYLLLLKSFFIRRVMIKCLH